MVENCSKQHRFGTLGPWQRRKIASLVENRILSVQNWPQDWPMSPKAPDSIRFFPKCPKHRHGRVGLGLGVVPDLAQESLPNHPQFTALAEPKPKFRPCDFRKMQILTQRPAFWSDPPDAAALKSCFLLWGGVPQLKSIAYSLNPNA